MLAHSEHPARAPCQPSIRVINMMYGIRYDTTNSSPRNLAQLQTCLQKFKAVQGIDPRTAGDEGELSPVSCS